MTSPTHCFAAESVRFRKSLRRGFTLVELSVVLVLSSMIMSTVAVTVHRMYRADREARDELAESAALMRLAAQFRSDAHGAQSILSHKDADESAQGSLIMQLAADETIEYFFAAGAVQRVKQRGVAVIHRDSFRLQRDAQVQLLAIKELDAPMAALVITAGGEFSAKASPTYRIDAAIGLDHLYGEAAE